MGERTILHVDMNAFFASVEQEANPHLKGKPVLVCGNPEGRTVVATSSYEARRYGVKTGMTIPQAKKLCPHAILVQCDPDKYVDVSTRLLSIYRSFTPLVEAFSVDEAFLDLTGTQRLWGSPLKVAQRIKSEIKRKLGLLCSVGIASNKLLSKLASNSQKPDGLVYLRDEDVSHILEKLPVSELCGVGPRLMIHLNNLGIETCSQLASFPVEILKKKFGKVGTCLHLMGKGIGENQVLPYYESEPIKSMGHSVTLNKDLYSMEDIGRVIFQLSEQVARRLRHHHFKGKTICLTLRYPDFSTNSLQKTIPRFVDDGKEICDHALNILKKSYNPNYGVRLLGVSVSNLVEDTAQLSLFGEEQRKQKLLQAMDRINDKWGDFKITWARLMHRARDGNVISPAWRPHKHLRRFSLN
jgi:DNA polymerase-4